MTEFFTRWGLLILSGAALVIIVIFSYLRSVGNSEKGAHRRVSSALRRFASVRGYRVLDNVTLHAGSRTLHADHVLVGYFGLLVVADLCDDGDYYGKLDDPHWARNTRGSEDNPAVRKGMTPNPLPENLRFVEHLRGIFSRNGVYNISIDSLAVAANPRSALFISGRGDIVLALSELRGFLGRDKYSQDNGLDVEKLCSLLQS